MKTTAIVVGIDKWKRATAAFYKSFRRYNPEMSLLILDNGCLERYPVDLDENTITGRIPHRLGYNLALNFGLMAAEPSDWYICFNNDVAFESSLDPILSLLDEDVLYGSGENINERLSTVWPVLQWSAWLVVSQKILDMVGYFDPKLTHAFEDFDYEIRAMNAGFGLATAYLPAHHRDRHSRFGVPGYWAGWEESRLIFSAKHGLETELWDE